MYIYFFSVKRNETTAADPAVEKETSEGSEENFSEETQATQGPSTLSCTSSTVNESFASITKTALDVSKRNSKHKVGYDKSWENGRLWLRTEIITKIDNSTSLGMFCLICRKFKTRGVNGSLVWSSTPCSSLRLDRVQEHQKSSMHIEAVKREIEQKILTREEITFPPAKILAIEGAMKSVKFFIDHDIPLTTTFKSFIEFCVNELQSPVLTPMKVAGNATYTSTSIQDDFVSALSTVCQEYLLQELKRSPAASLLIDEAKDKAVRKHLAFAVKYISKTGEVQTAFLDDMEIPNGTSELLMESIKSVCASMDLPLTKFQAIGTDGASAMVGCNSGVVTRLRAAVPNIIAIHCMNHRLALGSKDSFEGVRFLDELHEVMQGVYNHYNQSTNNSASLKAAQSLLQDLKKKGCDFVTLKQASFARWLSHELQVSSLRRSYLAVLTDLENTVTEKKSDAAAARGLLKKLKQYKTYYGLCYLNDVLAELASLSLFLQSDSLIVSELETKLALFYVNLRKLTKKPGLLARKAEKNASEMGIVPNDEERKQVEKTFCEWIPKLETEIENRFQNQEVVSALGALNLSKTTPGMLDQYGLETLEILSSHFGINENELTNEWEQLKELLKDVLEISDLQYMYKFILKIEETVHVCNFKHLKFLLAVAHVLPLSTACVERIFAQVKNIVTDQRNRLCVKKVSSYLRIKFTSSDCINYTKAAELFLSQKHRRIVSLKSSLQ